MKATTSKENGIWVIKLYLDKNETLTDKNLVKAYRKVDEAFGDIKETNKIEKTLKPIMEKDKLIKNNKECDHINSYDFHENAPGDCLDCEEYINE